MWQTISSKEVFSHPRLTLIEDEVVLPNGVKTSYLKFRELGNAVTVICRNEKNQILLQREYSYPPNRDLYQFLGGFVPSDENISAGANRELMEEAKLFSNTLVSLGEYLVNNRRSNAKMFVFLATDLEERALPGDPEEVIESFWFEESEIDQMIVCGEIVNPHVLASWTLYKLKKSMN
ncbi:MAG: NUDIX hydrolase [Patescibacteria group bacterium]